MTSNQTQRLCEIAALSLLTFLLSGAALAVTPSVAEGAKIYNENCGRCHNPRPAEDYTASEWSVIMPHMRERAHLTRSETLAVEMFLSSTLTADVQHSLAAKGAVERNSGKSGEELFAGYGCLGCHRLNDEGGVMGPRLTDTIQTRGDEFFVRKLLNPSFNNPSTPMPRFPLTEDDASAIVEYVKEVASRP